ncbi:MAG: hypothetical protein P8J37_02855 [Fuerstiella sp.]|nr:hypothetical protein [Fuerstiella sp.]
MDTAGQRADRVFALVIVAEILLILATWPLWTAIELFPAVPMFRHLGSVPIVMDWLTLAALLVSSAAHLKSCRPEPNAAVSSPGAGLQAQSRRYNLWLMAASASWLVVLNQHRLQPWHWLFLIVTAQSILLSGRQRLWAMRLTFATIYIFAALSRLGADVDAGMSRQLLQTVCHLLGADQLLRNERLFFIVCLAMTLVELAVGLCLLLSRFRRLAVVMAMALHLTLLVLLSPIGLNHHWGVLIWNAFFLIAIPLLFADVNQPGSNDPFATVRLRLTAAIVVLFPLSGLFDIADNWPSWQLYSPRPDIVRLYVDEGAVGQLPKHVRQFVAEPAPLDTWCPVRLDWWSLAMTGAPIYPEDRFQLNVVRSVVQKMPDAAVRITLESAESPAWWRRTLQQLRRAELDDHLDRQFLLNGNIARK